MPAVQRRRSAWSRRPASPASPPPAPASPTATWSPTPATSPSPRCTSTDPMPGLSAVTCPSTDAGPGRLGDLHRHLHHHPGRRRPRAASPTPAPRSGTPPSGAAGDRTSPRSPSRRSRRPAIALVKTASFEQLRGRRHADHLQLPGDQHRQRDPDTRHRDRSHARPLGDHLPGLHAWRPARLGDLHRHLHHHPGRRGRRPASPTPAPRPARPRSGPAVTGIVHR